MIKLTTFLLLFTVFACAQPNEKPVLIEGWKSLDKSTYFIQYPQDWELNQGGQMGASFVLYSPIESNADSFRENVNLVVQDLSGQDINLDKYTELSEEQIGTMITNASIVKSMRVKTETGEYQKNVFTGDQGLFHLKFVQYYWVIDSKAMVLTFTCEQDNVAKFGGIGEKIRNSFILK